MTKHKCVDKKAREAIVILADSLYSNPFGCNELKKIADELRPLPDKLKPKKEKDI